MFRAGLLVGFVAAVPAPEERVGDNVDSTTAAPAVDMWAMSDGPDVGTDFDWAAQGSADLVTKMQLIGKITADHNFDLDAAADAKVNDEVLQVVKTMTVDQYQQFYDMSVKMAGDPLPAVYTAESTWEQTKKLPKALQDVYFTGMGAQQYKAFSDFVDVTYPGGLTAETAFPQIKGQAEMIRKVLLEADISVLAVGDNVDSTTAAPAVAVTDGEVTEASGAATISTMILASFLAFWS